MTAAQAPERLELSAGGLELGEHPSRTGDEQLPGGGDRHVTGGPFHQRHPHLVLQLADLLGERRLRDVLAGSGPGEVPLLCERDQIAQLPQIHKLSL